jgi:two-component system, chemotaxis family, chemotaxis protein CheY
VWTVLVVDDSSTMRELIGFAVKRLGPEMHVIEAEHGGDALDKMHAMVPDVVITDLNMPVMPGLVLIERMRSEPAFTKVPIIIITTETNADERDEALARGANAYVTKPIRAPQVVAVLTRILPELAELTQPPAG